MWTLLALVAAAQSLETVGAWTIDLQVSDITGATTGGATTPAVVGHGYMGIGCVGRYAVPLFVFSGHSLAELDLDEAPVPFGYEGSFVVPFRGRVKKLEGPAFIRGDAEGFVLPGKRLWDVLLEEPRDVLAAANARPGRARWPSTVRYSLDGFREAWDRVDASCREHPGR